MENSEMPRLLKCSRLACTLFLIHGALHLSTVATFAQEATTPTPSITPAARDAQEEAAFGPVRRVGGSVLPPQLSRSVPPQYSEQARKAKFSGVVLVGLVVDKDGTPRDVHILRGVGMGLDESAMAAIRQYSFRPATENGEPVAVRINVEINFRINDKKDAGGAAPESPESTPASGNTQPAAAPESGPTTP